MNARRFRRKMVDGMPRRLGARRAFTLTEMLAVMAILSMIIVSLFTIFQQGTETWRLSSARTEIYIKARQILEMMAREIKGAVMIPAPCGPQMGGLPSRADLRGLNGQNAGDELAARNDFTLQGWRNSSGGIAKEQRYSDQVYFVAPRPDYAGGGGSPQEFWMIGYWVQDMNGDTVAPVASDPVPRQSKDDVLMRYTVYDQGVAPQQASSSEQSPRPSSRNRWFDFLDPRGASSQYNNELALSVRALDVTYYDYDDSGRLRPYNAWDSRPSNTPGPGDQKGTTPFNLGNDSNRLPVAVRIEITVGDKEDVIKPIRLSAIVYLANATKPFAGTGG